MDLPRSSAKASTHPCSMREAASVARLPLHCGADGAVGMQGRVLRRFFLRKGISLGSVRPVSSCRSSQQLVLEGREG